MAINNTCVVMLVGHGAISNNDLINPMNTKNNLTANHIGDYVLAYPVPPGDSLERFGHNALLHTLSAGLKPADTLTSIMEIKSASHCNRVTAEIAPVKNPTHSQVIIDYITKVKIRAGSEHSIANADNVLTDTAALLPSEITDYVLTRSLNFSTLMEGNLNANLAIRRLDPPADPNLTYVTGLGEIGVYYNNSKLELLLRDHKQNIILANTNIKNAFNALEIELNNLVTLHTQGHNILNLDQQNGITSLCNQIQSNDKDVKTIWAGLLLNAIFPVISFGVLHQMVTNYITAFDDFTNIINQNVKFDNNNLLYITLGKALGNNRGLKIFWSSFLQDLGSLYFAFENDIADPTDLNFAPIATWFVTPNDQILNGLNTNFQNKFLIVSIPSDANIVYAACRTLSEADTTEDPQTHLEVEIFPEF